MDVIAKPINRIGIQHFLVDAFGDKYNGLVNPMTLAKQLFEFDNVGDVVYKRNKSKKAESMLVVQNTILQLISANIICIEMDLSQSNPYAHCKLCFDKRDKESTTYMQPHYVIEEYWRHIIEID